MRLGAALLRASADTGQHFTYSKGRGHEGRLGMPWLPARKVVVLTAPRQ